MTLSAEVLQLRDLEVLRNASASRGSLRLEKSAGVAGSAPTTTFLAVVRQHWRVRGPTHFRAFKADPDWRPDVWIRPAGDQAEVALNGKTPPPRLAETVSFTVFGVRIGVCVNAAE